MKPPDFDFKPFSDKNDHHVKSDMHSDAVRNDDGKTHVWEKQNTMGSDFPDHAMVYDCAHYPGNGFIQETTSAAKASGTKQILVAHGAADLPKQIFPTDSHGSSVSERCTRDGL
jgi:hypothetical protein